MKTMTFQSTARCRATEETDEVSLTYTDTICEDGTVRWSVRGRCDGSYCDESGTRKSQLPLPIDFESVRTARLNSGWVVR